MISLAIVLYPGRGLRWLKRCLMPWTELHYKGEGRGVLSFCPFKLLSKASNFKNIIPVIYKIVKISTLFQKKKKRRRKNGQLLKFVEGSTFWKVLVPLVEDDFTCILAPTIGNFEFWLILLVLFLSSDLG